MTLTAIVGARTLTMDPQRREFAQATIFIEDNEIIAVGAGLEAPAGARVIDARGKAVMPGLVNAHTHVPQILLRGGYSHDRPLYEWLYNVLYPGLSAYDLDDVRCATLLFATEALLNGVTTIVDNEDAGMRSMVATAGTTVGALAESGIRAVYARMFADHPAPGYGDYLAAIRAKAPDVRDSDIFVDTDRVLADLDEVVRRYDGAGDGRIRVWPSPAIPGIVSLRALRRSQEIARERDTMWTMHVAEDERERVTAMMGAVEYLDYVHALDDRLLAAHCVDITDREIRLIAEAGTKVSTQPASNAFLAAGVAPVPQLLRAGVTVGIGTDDANCSDAVDVFGSMKLLALLHRAVTRDAGVISPRKVVEMATIDGAHALGMGRLIGSIEPGKRADLVILDLDEPRMTPAVDLYAALVFQQPVVAVRTVLVDGRTVVADGLPTFLASPHELGDLVREATRRSSAIAARAGLRASS
jgi:atrazine chlorohydrolase/5-methylthioadenosine/S-adenosylhomocysteine deaminase/melamine deaminase